MAYDWGGTRILQRQTLLAAARFVPGHEDTPVTTDLREWIVAADREGLARAIRQIELPVDRKLAVSTVNRRANLTPLRG